MSTKKDKRVENRGNGMTTLKGLGQVHTKNHGKTLMFVEREPDNLLAAALICYAYEGDFTVKFTDRHSINYDITKYSAELENDNILILCPSINEYSILYLNKLCKPYCYIGSSTKIEEEFVNDNIHLTSTPASSLISEYLNISNEIIKEVVSYTQRYFPTEMDLYNCIRYQYLCFKYKAKDLFEMLLGQLEQCHSTLELDRDLENELWERYNKQLAACDIIIGKSIIRENDNKRFVFIQGGCPCTLILNRAVRTMDCDVYVNVCLNRQHFTVLMDSEIQDVYMEYIDNFIYSGRGEYSAGGCFEKDCNIERFIDAFFNHYKIHGFYSDRSRDYNDFDPTEYEWITCESDLTDKFIYKNFNFTIFLDSYCNADCRFCIEQIKTENIGRIEKGKIDDGAEYIKRLDEILGKVRPLNPSLSVTGGEPLLSSYFGDAMKLLKKYNFRKTVITTNGSDIEKHMEEIIDAGISHINFSRPHYDDDIVQDIMRFKDKVSLFKGFDDIIRRLESEGVRTRFNCILTQNGVNSVAEMKKYMDFVRTLGCKHVVFRELMSFNESMAMNQEKRLYSRENRVYINDLWNEIDGDSDFRYFMNMQGHYYYIEIYKYKDMTMVSERANIKSLEDNRVKNDNYVYEMIFHPNGNLCAGWSETEDILDGGIF